MDESGITPDVATAAPAPTPDIRSLIDQSRKMGATDDQIRSLMVKAPFLADTWKASEKAGISPDAVFQHFGIAAPADPALAPDQSAGIVDDYGRPVDASAASGGELGKIAGAAAEGAKAGFGDSPLGMSPKTDQALVDAGVFNAPDEYNPLKGINRALIGGGAAVGDLALRAGGALVGAYQHGIAQAGESVGLPKLGRDLAALPEAFPTGDMTGGTRLVAPSSPVEPPATPRFVSERFAPQAVEGQSKLDRMTQLIAHDNAETAGSGVKAAAAETEQRLAAAKVAAIGSATDIDGVIAAAGEAAAAPVGASAAAAIPEAVESPQMRLLRQTEGAILRRVGGDESRLTDAENVRLGNLRAKMAETQPAAPLPSGLTVGTSSGASDATSTPVPQSVGAAASRDMTQPELLTQVTPAQKATALQKMVNQSADDRLTPGGRDDAVYVPGVERPEAMRDFSPAADGEMSSALAHKTLYNTDSNYHDQFDARVKKNNDIMVDKLNEQFGDANAREAAMSEAKDLMPGPVGLFDGERAVNAQPIADKIKEILSSPAGKRGAVESQLKSLLPKLFDNNGNIETMPSMLKGIRDDITDRLYDKSPTTEGNSARTASNQLRSVLQVVDDTIGSGLPGTKYQDYLSNLSAALGQVSKLDYFQRFLTGSRKITDLAGNLQFSKVQKLLEDIQLHHADNTGGAKEITPDEIHQIEAVRNELAAKDLLDRRASVRGSPTAQITNSSGILGHGPLGAGVRGAAEVALHGALAATTGGVGNAILGGYRYIAKPMMDVAKAQEAAATLAATKQRLLDTTPRQNP